MIFIDLSKIPIGKSNQEYNWHIKGKSINENNDIIDIYGIFEINNKYRRDYFFNGSIKYELNLKCDRCNGIYKQTFNELLTFIIKVNSDIEALDIINTNSNIVNLFDYFRDIIITAIPLKRLCNEKCKGLCIKCGTNLNNKECNCENT